MKKNYFKKVAAIVAAASMMSATTAVVNAYEVDKDAETPANAAQFNLDIEDVYGANEAGETVAVKVKIAKGSDIQVDAIGISIVWDEGLKIASVDGGSKVTASNVKFNDKKLVFNYGGDAITAGEELFTINFTVPAKSDKDKYEIKWSIPNGFNMYNTKVDANELVDYNLMDGFIAYAPLTVVTTTPAPVTTTPAPVTTTPAPVTTTEATTTTVVTTTTAVTTTPEVTGELTTTSATTTAATTTTTKATTTSNVGSSPATGSSNNGVAALAATMVAAAGAAVVLKKKKD